MSTKAFKVCVELDIQAVTCPGVWLCPNGRIILNISMFGNVMKTFNSSPIFPLLYHQKFTFKKIFSYVHCLTELQDLLGKEFLQAELLQCSTGANVCLASFETTLDELLYPSPCVKGLIAGVNVDLLMEPTKHFPGILAPKIEVLTKTTIEEIVDSFSSFRRNPGLINPKMLSSKCSPTTKNCHRCWKHLKRRRTLPFSKKLDDGDSSFVVKETDDSCVCTCEHCFQKKPDSLMQSQNTKTLQEYSSAQLPIWTSESGKIYRPQFDSVTRDSLLEKDECHGKKIKRDSCCRECQCCDESQSHQPCNCSVCNTYKSYFDQPCDKPARELHSYICSKPKKCMCCDKCCGQGEVRLAGEVQHNVSRNLNHALYYPFVGDNKPFYEQSKIASYSHRAEFYRSLEKFYKQLHKRIKQKASQEVE